MFLNVSFTILQSSNGNCKSPSEVMNHGKLCKNHPVGKEGRVELHEKLGLTGAEISVNELPAGADVPFVHSHKENEEIYGILAGKGKAVIDGEIG